MWKAGNVLIQNCNFQNMWIRHFNNNKQECDFPSKEMAAKANQRQHTNKKGKKNEIGGVYY